MRHLGNFKPTYDDVLLIPDKVFSNSLPTCSLLLIATSVYTCVYRISTFFTCGYLISIALLIFCGFMLYYGVWMMCEAFIQTSQDSSTMIWNSFSKNTTFFDFLLIFITSFSFIHYYYKALYIVSQRLLFLLNINIELLRDYFFITIIASFIVVPCVYLRQDLKLFKVFVFIKLFCIVFIFFIELFELFHHKKPNNFQTTMINFSWIGLFRVFSHIVKCYCMHVLYYPIASQLKLNTPRRIKKMSTYSIFYIFVITTTFVITQYFSFGDDSQTIGTESTIDLFIHHKRCLESLIMFCTLALCMTICSLQMFFFPTCRSVLCIIKANTLYPKEIWAVISVCVAMLAIFIGNLDGFTAHVISFVQDIFTGLITFVYPVVLYVGTAYSVPWFHKIGCALMIVSGIIFSAGNFYDCFWGNV